MCYTRHSGYGGYGDWARGGRQIVLNERQLNSDLSTWVRLENGTISGSVQLNATYGDDVYAANGTAGQATALVPESYYLIMVFWTYFLVYLMRN